MTSNFLSDPNSSDMPSSKDSSMDKQDLSEPFTSIETDQVTVIVTPATDDKPTGDESTTQDVAQPNKTEANDKADQEI